jgi:hypothetical protein
MCYGSPRLDQESVENIEALLEELKDGSCQEAFRRRSELTFEAVITDYDGAPFAGVTARCSEEAEILATSDDRGRISLTVDVRGTLPCGLVDCTSLDFAHPTDMSGEQELDLREVHMREIALRRE